MNLRNASLSVLLCLAACNGSNSSTQPADTSTSTFTDTNAADVAASEAKLKGLQTDIAAAETRLISLNADATAKADAVTAAVAALSQKQADLQAKTDELAAADARLIELKGDGTEANPGAIAAAEKVRARIQDEVDAKKTEVADAIRALGERQGQLTKVETELANAKNDLLALTGDGTKDKPGSIATADATLKELNTKIVSANEALKTAQADAKKTTDEATLKAARIIADAQVKAGLFTAAADTLKTAGLLKESADILKQGGLPKEAGEAFRDAGMENEAFDLLAPKDYVLNDKNNYDTDAGGSIKSTPVNETTSVKRQQMTINGKTIKYTAQAGHLIAYAPKDAKTGKEDAEVAIFYTAYTRDGLPKEKRPVTFLWNGGPGSAAIWLHMGSWGPMRIKSDAPSIPAAYQYEQPTSLPSEENAITLLDKTDLVFVDPAGTGYSSAIFPHTNQNFWGTDPDGQLIADFITRHNNVNNRQSSPKYLYGESYGGIRTPIVADTLLNAGTSRFTPDSSSKPQIALSGFILNSPLVDYLSNCNMLSFSKAPQTNYSCAGYLPSYAMTGDFFKLATARGNATAETYLQTMREFVTEKYIPTLTKYSTTRARGKKSPWANYVATQPGKDFLEDLYKKTGIPVSQWKAVPNLQPPWVQNSWITGSKLGRYDARMKLPELSPYNPDNYIDLAFVNGFKTYMEKSVNYKNGSAYSECCTALGSWIWPHRGSAGAYSPSSIPDFKEALSLNPSLKVLVLHGYEDIATPGFQTELDLKNATMADRVPVKWFEGGHMIYNTEVSRDPLKKELDKYYDEQCYSVLPTVVSAESPCAKPPVVASPAVASIAPVAPPAVAPVTPPAVAVSN